MPLILTFLHVNQVIPLQTTLPWELLAAINEQSYQNKLDIDHFMCYFLKTTQSMLRRQLAW
jgi:hypothetical protein